MLRPYLNTMQLRVRRTIRRKVALHQNNLSNVVCAKMNITKRYQLFNEFHYVPARPYAPKREVRNKLSILMFHA